MKPILCLAALLVPWFANATEISYTETLNIGALTPNGDDTVIATYIDPNGFVSATQLTFIQYPTPLNYCSTPANSGLTCLGMFFYPGGTVAGGDGNDVVDIGLGVGPPANPSGPAGFYPLGSLQKIGNYQSLFDPMDSLSVSVAASPEPGTFALFGVASLLAGMVAAKRHGRSLTHHK